MKDKDVVLDLKLLKKTDLMCLAELFETLIIDHLKENKRPP